MAAKNLSQYGEQLVEVGDFEDLLRDPLRVFDLDGLGRGFGFFLQQQEHAQGCTIEILHLSHVQNQAPGFLPGQSLIGRQAEVLVAFKSKLAMQLNDGSVVFVMDCVGHERLR